MSSLVGGKFEVHISLRVIIRLRILYCTEMLLLSRTLIESFVLSQYKSRERMPCCEPKYLLKISYAQETVKLFKRNILLFKTWNFSFFIFSQVTTIVPQYNGILDE